jgi:hypothetical protein
MLHVDTVGTLMLLQAAMCFPIISMRNAMASQQNEQR